MNLYYVNKKDSHNKYIIYLFLLIPILIIFSKFITEFIIIIINFYIFLNYKKCLENINNIKEENRENLKIFLMIRCSLYPFKLPITLAHETNCRNLILIAIYLIK